MDEHQLKGLFYNCDEKYFPRHKCKERTLFMAMFEDISKEEVDVSSMAKLPPLIDLTPPSDPPEVELMISPNALTSFSTPQTLKLIDYNKNLKVIILVDSSNICNFIHHCIA